MKTVEISDELYDKIMKRDKFGKPFESILWSVLESEQNQKEMLKDAMKVMLAAATGKNPEDMKRLMDSFDDADRQAKIKRCQLDP